jgi:hypothetical protein
LSDFWSFQLYRPSKQSIKEKILLKIYKLYYDEMCSIEKLDVALDVLRNKIAPLLEENINKADKIKKLTNRIIYGNSSVEGLDKDKMLVYNKRYSLFEYISKFLIYPSDREVLNR